ncbi:AMP-binding domain-containing protein [Haematococcus lacustris]|uniref:AMP-binding domain-containing protein n=1 Tax=Haematococcus lacustris TaxID=44745 RepID=A0A699ZE98_HAELA|nr:AMP-binding domain-containing protein [Haematococcus lacustris]
MINASAVNHHSSVASIAPASGFLATAWSQGPAGHSHHSVTAKVLGNSGAGGRLLVAAAMAPPIQAGIFGINSPEWIQAMVATSAISAVCVPLYDTLGPQASAYIMRHASLRTIFVQLQLVVVWDSHGGTPDLSSSGEAGLAASTQAMASRQGA